MRADLAWVARVLAVTLLAAAATGCSGGEEPVRIGLLTDCRGVSSIRRARQDHLEAVVAGNRHACSSQHAEQGCAGPEPAETVAEAEQERVEQREPEQMPLERDDPKACIGHEAPHDLDVRVLPEV